MHFFRLKMVAALLIGITLISVASTYFEVIAHKHTMRNDLARKTQWFSASLEPVIEQIMEQRRHVEQLDQQGAVDASAGQRSPNADREFWSAQIFRLRRSNDQPGVAIFDRDGQLLAFSGDPIPLRSLRPHLIARAMSSDEAAEQYVTSPANADPASMRSGILRSLDAYALSSKHLWYEDVTPLHASGKTIGALVLFVNADYIRNEGMGVWKRSFLRIAAMVVLVLVVTLLMVRWFLQEPVNRAAEWLHRLRHGEADVDEGAKEFGYLVPLANEVTSLAENLTRARAAAETEARLRDAGENVWTAHRLAVHVREHLGNGKLFMVSNREPYMHVRRGGETECIVPPSGLVTAIEPILQACDGTWIAHGSGGEDVRFVDAHDRLRVPPNEKLYTLRRVWLSAEEESGYYEGFSNEGLWPLCHIAHTRPTFRASDWKFYKSVNKKFCDVLVDEMREVENPVVFVQDYHFALLPRLIKLARPDARVAIFWHIPWPNAEVFGICPWQSELMDGLVAADIIGFHLQSHCNNFMATVDRALEARTDWENFTISRNGHRAAVRPYPISVAWDEHETRAIGDMATNGAATGSSRAQERLNFANPLPFVVEGSSALSNAGGSEGRSLVLGVDRMDYTKGIIERLLAFEHLLEEHASYRERVDFVQIASPSRTRIPVYAQLKVAVEETVERINRRYQTSRWKPIQLIQRQCDHAEVKRYYQAADVCVVTSLHDGMNLVAKEYVAARSDGLGVLILSRFAGASQELRDALAVNPYDIEQVTSALDAALQMSLPEQRQRMERMRRTVRENNVYRWASNILTDICSVRLDEEILSQSLNRAQRKLG